MQNKKQQLELDMEQQAGSKLGKEYISAVYGHLAYLTYMQSTSCEMSGWMNHKLESRLLGEISTTSDSVLYHAHPCMKCSLDISNFHLFFFFNIYLAVHVGSNSLTRDHTRVPCIGSSES